MSGEASEDELAELRSVSHGAVLSLGGVSLQKALLFLTNLALTAGLSVGIYGVYAFGWRLFKVLLRFAPFGAPSTVVRLLPEYRDDPARQNRILGLAYLTAFVTSTLIAVGVVASADAINAATIDHPAFPLVLRLFALLLPFDALTRLLGFFFRAVELIEYQVVVVRVVRPGLRLLAIAAAILLGGSIVGVVIAIAVATALAAGVALYLAFTRSERRPAPVPRRSEAASFYNYAVPNSFRTVGALFRSRVDVLLIGWLLTAEAAGVYNLALFLTSIITIPLIAFNQLFPPLASRLYAEGKIERLNSIYGTVTRLILTATLALAVTGFVYRTQLLSVFGEGYARGGVVLAVFVVGRVIGNGVGATGWLLLMTDHQYLRLADSWVLAVLNVGASYYFIQEFGLVGAALGTAGSLAVVNLLRLGQLWYLEGLQPYDATFLKPVGAAAGMAAAMVAVSDLLSGVALLVVGTVVGLATYGGLLALFGIEPTDRQLVGALAAQYGPAARDRLPGVTAEGAEG